MSTALTIGGWFATASIQSVFDHLSSYGVGQLGRLSGLENEVGKLQNSIRKVRVILIAFEQKKKKKMEDGNLIELLMELNDAAYDADDVLGELQYEDLRRKAERENSQARYSLSSSLPFVNEFLSNADDFWTDIRKKYEFSEKIRQVQERMDSIAAYMQSLFSLLRLDMEVEGTEIKVNRETTSLLTETKVFGRDEEMKKIVDILLESGDGAQSGGMNIDVLPIVGIGGIGKTTLAQYVYGDSSVVELFPTRMWVCVSENFDVKRLTMEMLQHTCHSGRNDVSNLNVLQEILKENLMGKRFLLVLDDIWEDVDYSKWEKLRTPLLSGAPGCKILVTTRLQKVADMMRTMDALHLKGLQGDVYWPFFKKCAFGDINSDEHRKLETIGQAIAQKLGGSPLAAKTVGGLLKSKLDEGHWTNIRESEIWELQQNDNDIMPILRLSYQHLPSHLKPCFAYCSLFPKDHLFDKNEIVLMWMSQGFIIGHNNMRVEDVGREYIDELLHWSFFQHWFFPFWSDKFVIHDLIHDLAENVSARQCLRIEDDKPPKISSMVRHVSVCTKDLDLSKFQNLCIPKLRTLIFHSSGCFGNQLPELLSELKSIRVLILKRCVMEELPESICNLKHLRCLDISGTKILSLPNSFCSLYNLQVFVMDFNALSHNKLPEGFSNIINLRHMFNKLPNSFCSVLADYSKFPVVHGIGKQTSLQELKVFEVRKENGHRITELQNLMDLHGSLTIKNLENVVSRKQASEARLDNKSHLESLNLLWAMNRVVDPKSYDVHDVEILEGLKPHGNLKHLQIESYRAATFPSWLMKTQSISNLETICLSSCTNLEDIPSLGQLPFLKFLRLTKMNGLKRIGNEFYGTGLVEMAFPSLEYLEIEDMPKLQEWSMLEGCMLFSRLRFFSIGNCPKLEELLLPQNLPAIRRIYISECEELRELLLPQSSPALEIIQIDKCKELVSLPMETFKYYMSLARLELIDCPKIISPPEEEEISLPSSIKDFEFGPCRADFERSLPRLLQNLASLRHLKITSCLHTEVLCLTHLTALGNLEIKGCEQLRALTGLHALTSLKFLTIVKCPQLRALTRLHPLTSLEFLRIVRCPQLRALRGLHALTSLKSLTIVKCCVLTAAPEPDEEQQQQQDAGGLSSLSKFCTDETSILLKWWLLKHKLSALVELRIQDSQAQALFTGAEGQELLWNLTSLRKLWFVNCINLQALPAELQCLSSLESVYALDCPELKSLTENGLPCSMKLLSFRKCHQLLKERCKEETGADWHKIATIDVYFD